MQNQTLRKIILSVLGIALIVGSVFIAKRIIANKKKTKSVATKVVKSVFTDTIQNQVVRLAVTASGTLLAKQRVEIYAEVQGIFRSGSRLFKSGQTYTKGQTLIRIDASEHYASVQSAKSSFFNSLSGLMPDLRLDYPEAYPKWQTYLSNFDLNKTTPELPKISSEKENFFITGRGILTAYYNVKNLEQRLTKYVITAPFSGVLTGALVTEGTLIRNGQKLGELIDPSVFELEIALSKSYMDKLEVGRKVTLTTLDKSESYQGIVSRVNGSLDVSTQTLSAYIEVRDKNLKQGIYLDANLDVQEVKDAVEIDRDLLVDNREVFVVRDSVLALIPVVPVHYSDARVVLKGIPDGTVILKRPVAGAYAGMVVSPFNNSNKPAK